MATLRPPFYSSNLLHLATKVSNDVLSRCHFYQCKYTAWFRVQLDACMSA
jgi:hypothetical protein